LNKRRIVIVLQIFLLTISFISCSREPTINAVIIHPTKTQIIYVGMKQGVFKSRDHGETWTAMNQGLESAPIRSLAIDPVLSSTIYAGTFAEAVFKSLDGGQIWRHANIGLKEHVSVVNSFSFHPFNPKIIYIGTTVGIYKTTDAGGQWHEIIKGMESVYTVSLIVHPKNPNKIFSGTSGGMYKSLDAGRHWIKINKGLIEREVGSALSLGVNSIVLDHEDAKRLFIGTSKGMFMSLDGGLSWKPSGSGLSDDSQYVAKILMDTKDHRILYAGTGGGIYKSIDSGETWQDSSKGLGHMVLWSMAMDPKNSNILYAGTQGGLFKSTTAGKEWFLLDVFGLKKEGEGSKD